MKQKSERGRRYLFSAATAVVMILIFFCIRQIQISRNQEREKIKIGLVLDGDEGTPYSANYIRAMEVVSLKYENRAEVEMKYNVPYEDTERVLTELCENGCDLVFTNSFGYGETAKKMAAKYPEVQFCEATCNNANEEPVYENYHTFMGEIYEGRYVAGKVAGLKMQEMIEQGKIKEDEAWAGYVGAYPFAEVISGYTAFFLGIRSECPSARMRVRYTNTWSSYSAELEIAEKLIDEGCVIISQHSDTIGPAIACENAQSIHPVYHAGYNQDMVNVAPTTSLIGTRIDWTPYFTAAVEAVLKNKKIEDMIDGHVHGNDAGAGFKEGWVKMLELNHVIAAKGSREVMEKTIKDLEKGKCKVFYGDYTGVDPENEKDTCDLREEYPENDTSSAPTFHYVLKDVIEVEE